MFIISWCFKSWGNTVRWQPEGDGTQTEVWELPAFPMAALAAKCPQCHGGEHQG